MYRKAPFVMIILFGIILFGCGKKQRDFDTLYLRLSSDVTTLDPALVVDVSGGILTSKLFNGLVRYDDKMNLIGDLAERWEISEDGCTYTFYLKQGVRFTNGRELTSYDIKYSFKRVLDKKTRSPRTWVFDRILGATEFMEGKVKDVIGLAVKDKYTIEITLKEPFSPFLGFLAMPTGYIVPKEEVERYGSGFSQHPVGTGPFKLREWRHDERIVLEQNEDYFDEKAKVKRIEYRIIPEELTALAEFELGKLDIMGLPYAEFSRFMENPKWRPYIKSQIGLNVYYLGLNCQRSPFFNVKVRQAINYAIDKDGILNTILKNQAVLAHGSIPPTIPGYNKEINPYNYDPEKAKRLLKEAGFKDGFRMTIYQTQSKEALQLVEIFQDQLKKVGIEAHIVQREWSAYKDAINKGEPDSFYLAWIADYPDAENFLYPLFHSKNLGAPGNRARFVNKRIDKMIEEAIKTTNSEDRIRRYREIERIINQEAPWVFLWHKKEFVIHQPWVRNYKPHPIYNADKGTGVEIIRRP
ncbi:MAG: ABC transporter substrate-binding protein [bacterium]|nr:ABC transporter substrate-binding protein [bacterium]